MRKIDIDNQSANFRLNRIQKTETDEDRPTDINKQHETLKQMRLKKHIKRHTKQTCTISNILHSTCTTTSELVRKFQRLKKTFY